MSVLKMVLDNNWAGLKEYCDETVATKLMSRINEKKIEVLAKLNGVSVDDMKSTIEKK